MKPRASASRPTKDSRRGAEVDLNWMRLLTISVEPGRRLLEQISALQCRRTPSCVAKHLWVHDHGLNGLRNGGLIGHTSAQLRQ